MQVGLSSACPSLLGVEVRTNGLGKLHSLPQITTLFASLILPLPAFTAGIKLMGGITLFLEVLSRFTGLVLSISMFVAYRTAVSDALESNINDPRNFYVADPCMFLFASLMILIFGAGLFSLDRLFEKLMANKIAPR